jgi:hypothetical protein
MRLLALLLCMVWTARALGASAEDLTWTLDFGGPKEWRGAIVQLLQGTKGLPRLAVASVLRRQAVLDSRERLNLVKTLDDTGLTRDPRVLQFLRAQAASPDPVIAAAALQGLLNARSTAVLPILGEIFRTRPEERELIARRVGALYRDAIKADADDAYGSDFHPHEAARLAREGREEVLFWPVYAAMAQADEGRVRLLAADGLRDLADRRAGALLWTLAGDGDPEVRRRGLWSLAYRRDARACDELIDRYWNGERAGEASGLRRRALADTGKVCAPTHLFTLFELVRAAPHRREEAEILLDNAVSDRLVPILEDAAFRERLQTYRADTDARLRHYADRLWERAENERRERLLADQPFWLGPAALIALALISALLGLVLFLWGFRLVQLLRLLRRLAPSTTRAVPMGTALLRGRLRAAGNRPLEHPLTGEPCLWYVGAERDHSWQRFWLEDHTGRILVNPHGAILLSADGVLVDDEAVQILGKVAREPASVSGTVAKKVLRKDRPRRTLAGRVGHFLVQGVLGLWSRGGTGMALFSDPLRCFWIWDDLDQRPVKPGRELARLLVVFLLAGLWITVFAVAALAALDRDLSQGITLWLNLD